MADNTNTDTVSSNSGSAKDSGTGTATGKEVSDDFVTRAHRLPSGLSYTTTTGRLVLRQEQTTDGKNGGFKPKAEIFLVSYVRDTPGVQPDAKHDDGAGTSTSPSGGTSASGSADATESSATGVDSSDSASAATGSSRPAAPNTRPVVFAFNGGPGSSSVWLHMGLLGPRMVDSGDVGHLTDPPFAVVDNPETILEHADLVLIDPVSTGFSRVVEGGQADEFHAFIEDRDLVAEVIRLWTTRNHRWLSPKYLVGESYGTLRAVAVAGRLFDAYGMAINGLGLISTVLNLSTLDFQPGNDAPYALHIPTYAAIAHYHGRHPGRELAEVVGAAEEFAARDFGYALSQGARLEAGEFDDVVARLSALTTLGEDFIRRSNLRWTYGEFAAELLRADGLTVGRIDGRFTQRPAKLNASEDWDDPSLRAINGPYSAAINHYVRAELGYENDLPYEILTGRVQPWSYKTFEGAPVDVTEDLERLLTYNRALRVHVDYGYHDGATPHFAAEYVWAHLNIDEEARGRFSHHYHEAGHMMYLNPEARQAQLETLARFVRG